MIIIIELTGDILDELLLFLPNYVHLHRVHGLLDVFVRETYSLHVQMEVILWLLVLVFNRLLLLQMLLSLLPWIGLHMWTDACILVPGLLSQKRADVAGRNHGSAHGDLVLL